MKRLRSFYRLVDCIAVSIGLLLCQLIENRLQIFHLPTPEFFFLCLFVIIALLLLFSFLFKELFITSTPLRKFILRNEFIEGLWLGGLGEQGFALTTILFDGSDLTVTGEQFNKEGDITWSWNSVVTGFRDRRLMYLSESSRHEYTNIDPVLGVTDMTFFSTKAGKMPMSMHGYWTDLSGKVPREQFTSERITDKSILKQLSSSDGRKEFIRGILKEQGQTPPSGR